MAQENPNAKASVTAELGSTGLKRWGGMVFEEFLNDLKGTRAIKAYQEMADNDATVGAIMNAIELLIRGVDWKVDPFSQDPDDLEIAEFVKSNMDDMERPWVETIVEILSMLRFGWSFHEIVYKYRRGWTDVLELSSKYDDGRLGWKKIPIRAQDTLLRWEFTDEGSLTGMTQNAPPTFKVVTIPMNRGLLFRTSSYKGNPEGRSILRNAYRPWFMKRHIENIEAIGAERDLAGLPIIGVPPELLASDASPEQKTVLAEYKKIVTQIKRDEQEGIVFPLAYDDNGNKVYDIWLLASSSKRQFDTSAIINRYKQDIAQTALADFILLGHEKVGSYALNSSKTSLFAVAIGAYLSSITEVFNRQAVPDLLRINGKDPSRSPKLSHGDIEATDLEVLGTFITQLAAAGVQLFPDGDLEKHLKKLANLPVTEHHTTDGTPGDLDGTPPTPTDGTDPNPDPATPAPDTTATPTDPGAAAAAADSVKDVALNGAQVSSLVDVVSRVVLGQLPRASALAIITTAFAIERTKAEEILGQAGKSFTPQTPLPEATKAPAAPNGLPLDGQG